MNEIELEELGNQHPINRAMRRVARYWPVIYSKLLCLEWEWTNDDGFHPKGGIVPYGATDGVTLVLNRKGVDAMVEESVKKVGDSVGYIAFLLVHEGEHAILNHGARLDKFADREAANHAADYKINEMTEQRNAEVREEYGIDWDVFPLPDWVLLDSKMSAPFSTEQLYQHLRKNEQPIQPALRSDDSVEPDADEEQEEEQEEEHGSDPTMGDNTGDSGDPATDCDAGSPGDPSGSDDEDGSPEPGDQNPDEGGGGGIPTPAEGTDTRPGSGATDTFKPRPTEGDGGEVEQAELEAQLEEQNEQLMIQDALDTNSHGRESAATRRIVKERRKVEDQDWGSIVEQFVEVRCESGWMSPYNHNVYCTTGLCAPGKEGKEVGDIVCIADSSGSIGPEAWQKFFELNQWILDEIQPNRVFLISCAEGVKDVVVLEKGDEVPKNMAGGGGTSFKAAFDWIGADPENLVIEPLLAIYFTDGWAEDHKEMDEPEYPVLWLSYSKPRDHFPWGEFAEITVK